MSTETDSLIDRLTTTARPVRPLPRPEVRAVAWLGLAIAVVAGVMAIHGIDAGALRSVLSDPRLLGEIAASAVTAIGATFAAFQTTVPGHKRGWLWLPFASLVVWLLLTGGGCVDEYMRIGPAALDLRLDDA